jgi:small acid-soluble spore protein B (major beta-type SASP)
MANRSSNRKVVPECSQALEQMKYEIAAELGLMAAGNLNGDTEFAGELGTTGGGVQGAVQWEALATRDAGAVGGMITRRLIQQAEASLRGYQ